MKGELVLAKAFDGRPLVRRLWEKRGMVTLICGEQQFAKLCEGAAEDVIPIGFPAEEVFRYEPELATELEAAFESKDRQRLAALWHGAAPLNFE